MELSVGDTPGSSGTTKLNVYKHTSGDSVGTSVFDVDGNKPQLASGTAYAVDNTPQSDLDSDELTFTSGTSFRVMLETYATGMSDVTLAVWLRIIAS